MTTRLGGITAIDLSRERVVAVHGAVSSGRVDLKNWTRLEPPTEIEAGDAAAFGGWLGGALREQKVPVGRLVIGLPRGDAALKSLAVPGAGSLPPKDLHEMVQLQMARHATMSGDASVVDYLAPSAGDDVVVAGAVTSPRIEWRRELARAAGGKLARLELRAAGAQAVAMSAGLVDDRAVLVVAPGPGECEVLVVDRGRLGVARGLDAPRPGIGEDVESYAKRIAVEAARTVMGHRVQADASPLETVLVLGRDGVAEAIAEACRAKTGLEDVQCCGIPRDVVRGGEDLSAGEAAELLPAIGLLVRAAAGIRALDFANPTAAPDTGARWRQLAMAAALGLIVVGGVAYLYADRVKGDLEARIEPLAEQEGKLRDRYNTFVLTEARLRHFEAWREPAFDWLGHLAAIEAGLPDPPATLVDSIGFASDVELSFKPGARLDDPAAWLSEQAARLRVGGSAASAEPGQAFRRAMLDHPAYAVRSLGPEVAGRFELELTTRSASPDADGSGGAAPAAEGATAEASS